MVVEWVTASEIGTLGFYLFRWDPALRRYVQVNDSLLPGLRAPQGGLYRLADDRRSAPGPCDLPPLRSGGRRRRAPLWSLLGAALARKHGWQSPDGDLRAAAPEPIRRLARSRRTSSTPPPRGALGGAGTKPRRVRSDAAIKLEIPSTGLYFVSVSQIAAELGITESAASALLAQAGLRLSNGGASVAWLPASNGSGLYFYGEASDDELRERERLLAHRRPACLRCAPLPGPLRSTGPPSTRRRRTSRKTPSRRLWPRPIPIPTSGTGRR